MAANIYDLSTTAASNTTIGGVDVSGTTGKVKDGDNVMRSLGAFMAQFADDLGGVNTVGGTGDAITVTLASGFTALASGQVFTFEAGAANTTATTINVNSLGTKAIRKISGGVDVALGARDLVLGKRYTMVYDSAANSAAGAWILLNPSLEAAYPTGHISGLTLSNNSSDATNDIDIAVGSARDGSDTENMVLASALTKRLDAAWAVGTGNGGLDTGSIADGTYHVWLIKRPDTGVVDALFSTSATAPTMPSDYTIKRRIGSIMRESAAIVGFVQDGDIFSRKVPVNDVGATNPGTSAVLRTLSVPAGIRVRARVGVGLRVGTAGNIVSGLITDPSTTDTTPTVLIANFISTSPGAGGTFVNSSVVEEMTNTSAQVRSRVSFSDANTVLYITTMGWADTRGR